MKQLFLEKAISLAQLAIGEEIPVSIGKILAGAEPERTNYFLQCFFQ